MSTSKKQSEPPELSIDDLRSECVAILTEYVEALDTEAVKNPGEHNVDAIRTARAALNLFQGPPTL